ncbi:Chaperone protein DnaJ OS=Streptomyces tendae OX=1932 GN=dnaJ PE=3 SV=1 [Streptomyces tendae]
MPLRMSSQAPCKACSGTGDKNGTPRVCPTCVGTGQVARGSGGGFSLTDPCPDCKGRGLIAEDPCDVCKGSGRAKSSRTMQVRIPAGVSDGQRIRLRGKGTPGERGGPAGDLYVVVHVKEHPVFGRRGDNLTVTVPVTYAEAALGPARDKVDSPTHKGVPAQLVPVVALTKANIEETVIADGFYKVSDICTAKYADACAELGLK